MSPEIVPRHYAALHHEVADGVESARRAAPRSVNAVMTAAHCEIRRRIVKGDQGGKDHAEDSQALIVQLVEDLTGRFRRA